MNALLALYYGLWPSDVAALTEFEVDALIAALP